MILRDHVYSLIARAIRRAIEFCRTHNTLTVVTNVEKSEPDRQQDQADVHESDAVSIGGLESQLKGAVVTVFGSARAAFDAHSKAGVISKKEFKKLLKKVLPSLKPGDVKKLRNLLPSKMSLLDFCTFIGDRSEDSMKGNGKCKADESSGLATLPPEVPEVCLFAHLVVGIDLCCVYSCLPAFDHDYKPKASCWLHCWRGRVLGRLL